MSFVKGDRGTEAKRTSAKEIDESTVRLHQVNVIKSALVGGEGTWRPGDAV